MNNVEASIVAFPMRYDTYTTHVAPAGNHGDNTGIEFNKFGDLSRAEFDLNGIVDLDIWVGISNSD
jgi:hypothetical protein